MSATLSETDARREVQSLLGLWRDWLGRWEPGAPGRMTLATCIHDLETLLAAPPTAGDADPSTVGATGERGDGFLVAVAPLAVDFGSRRTLQAMRDHLASQPISTVPSERGRQVEWLNELDRQLASYPAAPLLDRETT